MPPAGLLRRVSARRGDFLPRDSSGDCSQCAIDRKRGTMQPSLFFRAEHQVHEHDFLLAVMVMKAVHRMHRQTMRTEETLKEVLNIVANGAPVEMPGTGKAPSAQGSVQLKAA